MNNLIVIYGSPKHQQDMYDVLVQKFGSDPDADFKDEFRVGELGICLLINERGVRFVRTYAQAAEPSLLPLGTHPNAYLWDYLLPRYLPKDLLAGLRGLSDRYAKAFYRRKAQLSIGMNSLFDDEV